MAWSDIIAAGSGDVEFRLVVEGCPFEFVTSESMVGDCTEAEQEGKRRVVGLVREALGFSESVYIPGAEIDVAIEGVRIAETPGVDEDAASRAFASEAESDVATYLKTQLGEGAGDTTVTVLSTDYVVVGDRLHMGTEVLRVTAVPTSDTLTVERAQWRTTRSRHLVAAPGGVTLTPELSTSPWRYRGRRCWLYAHTHDELAVGSTGTIVWRGRVGAEPRLDDAGVEWSFPVESRWTLLDAEIGAAEEPIALRGVYRPGQHPLAIIVRRSADATLGGAFDAEVTVYVSGFWETEDEFLDSATGIVRSLNSNATIVSWGHTFSWQRSYYDGRWELVVAQPATPRYLEIYGGSRVDGAFNTYLHPMSALTGYEPLAGTPQAVVSGSTSYFVGWNSGPPGSYLESSLGEELRRFPSSINRLAHRVDADSEIVLYPLKRIYVSEIGRISTGDAIEIGTGDEEGDAPITAVVSDSDTAAGWIEVDAAAVSLDGLPIEASGAVQPELSAVDVAGDIDGDTLDGMVDDVIAEAPVFAAAGDLPWITTDDIADWATEVNLAALGEPQLEQRRWRFYSPVKLSDVVREECKLLGIFPHLNAEGKIAVRRLTVETSTSSSLVTIDDDVRIESAGYGAVDYDVDGSINTVDYQRYYDPKEDKHEERAWIQVRSIPSIQRDGGVRRVLTIEPKSVPLSGEIDRAFCTLRAQPVLHLFSGRLMEVRVDVSLAAFGVLCGDTVVLSIDQLPYRGVRRVHASAGGMRLVRAIVVGREWRLGSSAYGTLRCIVPGAAARTAGYSPTARLTAASNTSGTTWLLTCTQQLYGPSTGRDVSYFAVGDLVRLYQWDAATPAAHSAVVTVVSAGTNQITVTSATFAGLGGNTWNIAYDASAGSIDSSSTQQAYAGIADATNGLFETSGDGLLPDHYAP